MQSGESVTRIFIEFYFQVRYYNVVRNGVYASRMLEVSKDAKSDGHTVFDAVRSVFNGSWL